jgi:hypothetical protein
MVRAKVRRAQKRVVIEVGGMGTRAEAGPKERGL